MENFMDLWPCSSNDLDNLVTQEAGEVDAKPRWYSVLPAGTSSGSVSSKLINSKTEFSLGKRFESTAPASESSDPPLEKYEYQAEVSRLKNDGLQSKAEAWWRVQNQYYQLAATDDDEGIKLINTIDGSVARVLKGHRGSVTGISFDPKVESRW
ncbi:hypothetical protein POM88_029316 [Heracleum sosnowskyi]|uniref:Uncharacterized protein n=1 Tax=Heracleum sosnowskyi TaxID=360622 RepID=A0AAD8HVJ2_9APIA|nr:hypothetical protein POM88_029316 [Heracleum sosnowskyi]